jgi:predicted phage terminase large subunit-like protein
LLDVFRARLLSPELKRKVRSLALHCGADIIVIEKSGIGGSLLHEFANNIPGGMAKPIGILPKGDKIDRVAAQSAKIEPGQVHLRVDAPWRADLDTEVLAFPFGRHDDQIDSMIQFLFWTSSRRDDPPFTISLPVYGD